MKFASREDQMLQGAGVERSNKVLGVTHVAGFHDGSTLEVERNHFFV